MDESVRITDEQADALTSVVRELIRSESELVNQRVTWLLQIQGLLFAALAFAWEDGSVPLVGLLSCLGIVMAVTIAQALNLHSPAVRALYKKWSDLLSDEQKRLRLVIGIWSPTKGIAWALRPWRALPVVFVLAWAWVLVINYRRSMT